MPAYAGYNCRVTLNGTTLRGNNVTINVKADIHDVTAFDQDTFVAPEDATAGYANFISGVLEADISLEAHYFTEDNPFAGALAIAAGAYYNNLLIRLEKTRAPGVLWTFSKVVLESLDFMEQVRDAIHFSARFKNRGKIWTYPTT